MKSDTKNIAIIFLAASTLGLGVQLFRTRQQLADARKAPTLQVKRSEIKVAAAPEQLVAPPATTPAPADAPADGNSDNGPGPGGPGARGGRNFGAQMAEFLKDPEVAAAMKIEQEARLEQRYGALFKQLNLPADKLAELKTMLSERDNAMRDVMATAASQGLNPRDNRDELRKLTSEMQAEVDNNIKSTFGDSVVSALSTYNTTAPQRATVNELNQKLAYMSQPLNDTQSQMLTTILAETGQTTGGQGGGGGGWAGGGGGGGRFNIGGNNNGVLVTDATIARAQGVLMPSQVEALKKLQAEQQAQQLLQTKMRAARDAAQAQRNANRPNRNNGE